MTAPIVVAAMQIRVQSSFYCSIPRSCSSRTPGIAPNSLSRLMVLGAEASMIIFWIFEEGLTMLMVFATMAGSSWNASASLAIEGP